MRRILENFLAHPVIYTDVSIIGRICQKTKKWNQLRVTSVFECQEKLSIVNIGGFKEVPLRVSIT